MDRPRPRTGRLQRTARWLLFRLDDWTVHVPLDGETEVEDVVRAVRPRRTEDGFAVLRLRPPAELGKEGGPQLSIGDRDPRPDFVRSDRGFHLIEVAPSPCDPEDGGRSLRRYGFLCLADGSLSVSVNGDGDFVSQVMESMTAQGFRASP